MLNFVAIADHRLRASAGRSQPGSPVTEHRRRRQRRAADHRRREGHIGIFFAAVAVAIVAWLLFRSTLGFEIRTVGANPDAARYAGMRPAASSS